MQSYDFHSSYVLSYVSYVLSYVSYVYPIRRPILKCSNRKLTAV